jgi:hypothetical protein
MLTLLHRCLLLIGIAVGFRITSTAAFAPTARHDIRNALRMMTVPLMDVVPPAASAFDGPSSSLVKAYSSPQRQGPAILDNGIRSYLKEQPSIVVSLQERKIPTKEEIDQKKLTFNLIFWGGGFVAPFLATIFYFGFRFWEK